MFYFLNLNSNMEYSRKKTNRQEKNEEIAIASAKPGGMFP